MPSQITCASALPGKTGKHVIYVNSIFHLNAVLVPEFNQRLDFFNLFDSQLILTLLYDSLNLVLNVFLSGLLGEHGSG